MSDPLTPEERSLIDAAVAAGKVSRVAPGVSGEELVWCPKLKRLTAKDPERRGKRSVSWLRRSIDPSVVARRERVANLTEARKTPMQIAELIGAAVRVVHNDLFLLRRQRDPRVCIDSLIELRRRRVRELHGAKKTTREIMDEMDLSHAQVLGDLSAMGLTANVPKSKPPRARKGVGSDRQARLDKVTAMVAEGLTVAEMRQRLGGVADHIVRTDLAFLKLKAAPAKHAGFTADRVAARREKVRKLVGQGKSILEIAEACEGISPSAIYGDLKVLGISLDQIGQKAVL